MNPSSRATLAVLAFTVLSLLASATAALSVLGSPAAARESTATAKPLNARRDTVALPTGQQVTVDVTTNDRISSQERKARIKIVAIPIPNGLNFTPAGRQKVLVTAASVTPPGTYTARYRLIDAAGRTDGATIVVTVTAPLASTSTPAPTGTITEPSANR